MLKRIAVDIMQQFAPAFMVVCILLCLSFNYTFPLHRHPSDALRNAGSQQCASPNRAKKTTPAEKQIIGYEDPSDSGHYYANPEVPNQKLSGEDLRQYEQLVIMKKYPYLDLKEFEPKYHPVVKNAKFAREADISEGGNCQLTDEGPHVEIFSRGISGFGIPRLLKNPPAVVDIKLNLMQDPRRAGPKSDEMKLRENSRVLNSFKDLENEIIIDDGDK